MEPEVFAAFSGLFASFMVQAMINTNHSELHSYVHFQPAFLAVPFYFIIFLPSDNGWPVY